jgi:hypothetical protein
MEVVQINPAHRKIFLLQNPDDTVDPLALLLGKVQAYEEAHLVSILWFN